MTRARAPVTQPVVLTIAGSDSGGGAGIQADLKTIEAGGGFGTTAITSVTAQHTQGVESTHVVPPEEVVAQCEAVFGDFEVGAVKTGMLVNEEIIDSVAEQIRAHDVPTVVDPVMIAASGDRLLAVGAEDVYEQLIGASTLVTPNAEEAEILTGIEITDTASAKHAGELLVEWGVDGALIKGGHVPGDQVVDVLVTEEHTETATHPRIETEATHGSGCTLSAAIATRLAHGDSLGGAVQTGVDLLERAVRYSLDVGTGPGAVHHMVGLRERAHRQPTASRVRDIVDAFVDNDLSPLVPEVGMNVVGATPYAEAPGECAAVEGRITRTLSGVSPNRGVRFGASSHVARFLLAAREFDTTLQYAVNCRFDENIERTLNSLPWELSAYDRSAEPLDTKAMEGSTMQWGARQAFKNAESTPVAVIDRGEVGKEAMVKLLAPDAETLRDRTIRLLDSHEME